MNERLDEDDDQPPDGHYSKTLVARLSACHVSLARRALRLGLESLVNLFGGRQHDFETAPLFAHGP